MDEFIGDILSDSVHWVWVLCCSPAFKWLTLMMEDRRKGLQGEKHEVLGHSRRNT